MRIVRQRLDWRRDRVGRMWDAGELLQPHPKPFDLAEETDRVEALVACDSHSRVEVATDDRTSEGSGCRSGARANEFCNAGHKSQAFTARVRAAHFNTHRTHSAFAVWRAQHW